MNNTQNDAEGFRVISSVAADGRREASGLAAYEWWYFDFVSDTGRDLLVVIFLDNFIFSPRYNRAAHHTSTAAPPALPVPAIAVTWYRDGKLMLRSITEFQSTDFDASTTAPTCRIGQSGFRFVPDANGGSYILKLLLPLRRKAALNANLVWRVEEGDFTSPQRSGAYSDYANVHEWNVVAPRCAVSGTLTITKQNGARRTQEFRGTGYHDHNRDERPLPIAIAEWQWGRAHFADVTAIFYRIREHGRDAVSRLLLVRKGKLIVARACVLTAAHAARRRHHFGLTYARYMTFTALADTAQDDATLHSADLHSADLHGANLHGAKPLAKLWVDQERVVDGSFFYLRFAGQARLELDDNQTRRAPLISEHLAPRALRWRWLDWLTDMRISRNGRTSFLH